MGSRVFMMENHTNSIVSKVRVMALPTESVDCVCNMKYIRIAIENGQQNCELINPFLKSNYFLTISPQAIKKQCVTDNQSYG